MAAVCHNIVPFQSEQRGCESINIVFIMPTDHNERVPVFLQTGAIWCTTRCQADHISHQVMITSIIHWFSWRYLSPTHPYFLSLLICHPLLPLSISTSFLKYSPSLSSSHLQLLTLSHTSFCSSFPYSSSVYFRSVFPSSPSPFVQFLFTSDHSVYFAFTTF